MTPFMKSYLQEPINAVQFTAVKLNEALEEDKDTEEVNQYLIDASSKYEHLIDGKYYWKLCLLQR